MLIFFCFFIFIDLNVQPVSNVLFFQMNAMDVPISNLLIRLYLIHYTRFSEDFGEELKVWINTGVDLQLIVLDTNSTIPSQLLVSVSQSTYGITMKRPQGQ